MPRKKLKTAAEALIELFADDDSGDDDIPESMEIESDAESENEHDDDDIDNDELIVPVSKLLFLTQNYALYFIKVNIHAFIARYIDVLFFYFLFICVIRRMYYH